MQMIMEHMETDREITPKPWCWYDRSLELNLVAVLGYFPYLAVMGPFPKLLPRLCTILPFFGNPINKDARFQILMNSISFVGRTHKFI